MRSEYVTICNTPFSLSEIRGLRSYPRRMGANRLPLLVAPFTEYPGFPQMSTWGSPICGMRCEALSGSTAGDLFRVCHFQRFSSFWFAAYHFQPSERIFRSKPGNALRALPGFWYPLSLCHKVNNGYGGLAGSIMPGLVFCSRSTVNPLASHPRGRG